MLTDEPFQKVFISCVPHLTHTILDPLFELDREKENQNKFKTKYPAIPAEIKATLFLVTNQNFQLIKWRRKT
jgi:hypothetical protein